MSSEPSGSAEQPQWDHIGTPTHMIKTACAKFRKQNHPNNSFLLT